MISLHSKLFKADHYQHWLKKVSRYYKTILLLNKIMHSAHFVPVWQLPELEEPVSENKPFQINIFGVEINHVDIHWNKDYYSGFSFPNKVIHKIKPSRYYNRGIDIKFPWELSRFSFALDLASRYRMTNNIEYYQLYRSIIIDWKTKNPFLKGVNWLCTMDVAIRAINLIMSASVFFKPLEKDSEFYESFSKLLVEHACYINTFPEIYKNGHTTNHTTSDFVGLLFLSVALRDHKCASRWQADSLKGIHQCMIYQTYNDGGSFEAAMGYHRLITELFGLAAILCRQNQITLPDAYLDKLDGLFAFLSSIIDQQGNVPLFGDNDSGTILQFDFNKNNNYSYLLQFKTLIFNETVKHAIQTSSDFALILPNCKDHLQLPRENTDFLHNSEYIQFNDSGIDIIKEKEIFFTILSIPLGQNGYGGHNHYDIGSFTISKKGTPIIVDPGMYSYTRDLNVRNRFRSYFYHNTVIPEGISESDFDFSKLFVTKPYFKLCSKNYHREYNQFEVTYYLNNTKYLISRSFVFDGNQLKINDRLRELSDGENNNFTSQLFLSPWVKIIETHSRSILTNHFTIACSENAIMQVDNYDYSDKYNYKKESSIIRIIGKKANSVSLSFH